MLGVQKGVAMVGQTFKPKVLISDAAPSIINAFYAVFESAERNIVCWAHVKRNLQQKTKNMELLTDIDALQLSPNRDAFEQGVQLFFDKWGDTEKTFCSYFKKVWIDKNNSWFEGYCMFVPSTNNALEAFNNVIKRKYTFRKRLGIVKFNDQIFNLFKEKSSSYVQNILYAVVPTIIIDDWSKAIIWARNKQTNAICGDLLGIVKRYFVPSTTFLDKNDRNLTEYDVRKFNSFHTINFDKFQNNLCSIWVIDFDTSDWKCSECTCPRFLKTFVCKHILGIAIKGGFVKPPAAANPALLDGKKKRGRPAAVKKALIIQ